MKLLTPGAMEVLRHIVDHDTSIGSVALSQVFPVGERKMRTYLRELRENGFLITSKQKFPNGQINTVSYVTQEGFNHVQEESPNGAFRQAVSAVVNKEQANQLKLNSSLVTVASLASNKIAIKNTSRGARQGENMGYEFFESTSSGDFDDYEAERLKAERERKVEYQQRKLEESAKLAQNKAQRPVKDWSTKESVLEFTTRLNSLWGIPEWSLSGSVFFQVFGKARRQHGTTGDVELEMINIFFSNVKVNRGLTTGDILWKSFMAQYSTLAAQAKLRLSTPDKISRAVEEAEDSWKGL